MGDADPRRAKANESKTHRHSVIVVGFDRRRSKWSGVNCQSVGVLFDRLPDPPQFSCHGGNAVGLLVADMGHVANPGGADGERSHCRERLGCVTDGIHVDVDAAERPPPNSDVFGARFDLTSHLFKRIDKSDVTLEGLARQAADSHFSPGDRRRREEVARCGCVRLDVVVAATVVLWRDAIEGGTMG